MENGEVSTTKSKWRSPLEDGVRGAIPVRAYAGTMPGKTAAAAKALEVRRK